MGVDKARMPFPGEVAMAVHVAQIVAQVCGRVALIRRGEPRDEGWAYPNRDPVEVVWEPDHGPPHPLWGIATACEAATTERILVVPCDVPFLTAAGLQTLVDAMDAGASRSVVAWDGDRMHPLVCVLPAKRGLEAARVAAAGGSAQAFLADAQRERLPASELRNVNMPAHLDR